MTTQERHVFCAWCWRAVPAHGDTYIPRPHLDTRGEPCRGEAMCGATTYSVGTPPCERDKGCAFAYAVPSARDIEIVLAERSAEAEELRAENDRVAGLYLAAQAERAQAESDASHAHSEWVHERAANRRLREEVARLRRLLAAAARGKLRRCETCGERIATRRWRGTDVDVCDRCFAEDKRDAADGWETLDEEACEDLPHAAALRAAMEAAK